MGFTLFRAISHELALLGFWQSWVLETKGNSCVVYSFGDGEDGVSVQMVVELSSSGILEGVGSWKVELIDEVQIELQCWMMWSTSLVYINSFALVGGCIGTISAIWNHGISRDMLSVGLRFEMQFLRVHGLHG